MSLFNDLPPPLKSHCSKEPSPQHRTTFAG